MIKFLSPNLFPQNEIISGITLRTISDKFPFGFSISQAELFTEEEIEANKVELAKALNIKRESIVFQKQIHSDVVQIVKKNTPIYETDGMLTNEEGIFLCLSLADCCGILVYDREQKVIGAFHSGWKGTKQNIVRKGIELMKSEFQSNSGDILVWITPCAGKEDYEVGADVARYFPNFIMPLKQDKYLLDLKRAIFTQLIQVGINKNNIEISIESTISDLKFHSFRRDKDKSGRMAAFIGMI